MKSKTKMVFREQLSILKVIDHNDMIIMVLFLMCSSKLLGLTFVNLKRI